MAKDFTFLQAYAPIFYEDKTYWLISGGRGSGKSTQVSGFFLMRLMGDDFFRGVVARYTQRSISSSIYRDILDLINAWGLTPLLKISGEEIVNPKNGNMILTHSMKISEGTTVAKGKGLSRVTHLLIDEATEMASEEEYIKLIDSFRTKGERKIFLCFNPTSKAHWLFKRFYLPSGEPNPKWKDTHGFLHTTYLDNIENLDPAKVREWELAKETDPAYFDHHIRGIWKDAGDGQVFKNWHWGEHLADWDAETIWGLDFGFSSDPCALVQVKKRNNKIWLREFIYETGLTTEDLSHLMDLRGVPRHAHIYADSSDPKSIETLRRLGWNNIRPCVKGPDSIRHGIDTIHSYEVFASHESENLRLEYDNYVYRAGGDRPADSWNHLMDAIRYAVGTGLKIGQTKYVLMGSGRKLGAPI
jgi:phage terminase large subunit